MSLPSLPTELYLQILSYLDPASVISAAGVTPHFRKLVKDKLLRGWYLMYEDIEIAETEFKEAGELSMRPCYGCLNIVDGDDFFKFSGPRDSEEITKVRIGLDRALHKERRCFACDKKVGRKFEKAMISELFQVCRGKSDRRSVPLSDESKSKFLIYCVLALFFWAGIDVFG
ncbi:hypothetical protein GJ744_007354 [Endocarpon pusillum]|uniref:F-box domain-containing protein n=1 Tax=Endocarpon pusillum TaxID=364733 RepID=A0A8H7AIS5_9EURO|nr:hypothetical protein GJ744_007354 [Endocarpon pusillum]